MNSRAMRKVVFLCSVAVSALFALFVVARLTHAVQLFRVTSTSGYPSIKPGDQLLATSLKKPKRLDLISFTYDDSTGGAGTYIYRLCGMEGDLVEINNGRLFINHVNTDASLPLAHNYYMDEKDFALLQERNEMEHAGLISNEAGLVLSVVSDQLIRTSKITAKRLTLSKEIADEGIRKIYGHHWNQDQFGPVRVPQGKYFVLGDNRHNARDSRYIGFILQSQYTGTVLTMLR